MASLSTDEEFGDALATTELKKQPALTNRMLLVMAAAAGITVANLYYNQPLLAEIVRAFNVSPKLGGWIPMLTQIGYALGMFFFVPLGDFTERRRLIVAMSALSVLALVAVGLAHSFPTIAAASLAVGAASCVPQMLVPFAATLSQKETRGRAVGTVMSGLLVGILLARTISGTVGQHFGWRAMFFAASGAMVLITIVLAMCLPSSRAHSDLSYRELMVSLLHITRSEPVLRESAIVGGMLFAGFSIFWATMVFFVEGPPYGYHAQAAGLFGLVGVVGALSAPIAGRLSDVRSPRATLRAAVWLVIASFVLMLFLGHQLWALILGIVLLDAGVQGGHVSNLGRIYALRPDWHNRLNTVYMVSYFIGGAIGSALGTWAFEHWSWTGVCLAGVAMLGIAAVVLMRREILSQSQQIETV